MTSTVFVFLFLTEVLLFLTDVYLYDPDGQAVQL